MATITPTQALAGVSSFLAAGGLIRSRRGRARLPDLDDGNGQVEVVHGTQVEVRNKTGYPIVIQSYGAQDLVRLWPACRIELEPDEGCLIEVPMSLLGQESVQLAVRMRYSAKLLRVRRGASIDIKAAPRGRRASIQSWPQDAVLSIRDISHWSRVGLPEAGGKDPANVDEIFGQRSARDRLQSWAAMTLYLGVDKGHTEVAVPLQVVESTHDRLPPRLLPTRVGQLALQVPPGAVVIGTVRCGYGHHRIALALASYGTPERPALLHDFAAVEGCAPPVELLHRLDGLYSRMSRMASEDRTTLLQWCWNELLAAGDANAARSMRAFCERLKPLLLALPPDTPVVAAHTFVAITALLCGCRHVINLVFDNHAQPVHAVPPPAINLVQTPKCEQQLLAMGVPAANVKLVGHYVPKELADNAVADNAWRMERARCGAPRRFLFSVGGAGAQRSLIKGMLLGLASLARELRRGLQVVVNVGDHEHMRVAIVSALLDEGISATEYRGLNAAVEFAAKHMKGDAATSAPWGGFAIFSGEDPMEATNITDILIRAADILVTKPSELAFYPLPKLFINRIGNHEAQAAIRARELGDGTKEATSVGEALEMARLLASQDDLYLRMCESVRRQAQDGGYDGARRALELAQELLATPGTALDGASAGTARRGQRPRLGS